MPAVQALAADSFAFFSGEVSATRAIALLGALAAAALDAACESFLGYQCALGAEQSGDGFG